MHDDGVTRRRLLSAGGGIAIGALAGCVGAQRDPNYTPPTEAPQDGGQGGDGGGGGPTRSASATVNMVSTSDGDQIFDPDLVWLEVGGTVTWVNESGTHSTTAYAEANDKPNRIPSGAEAWDSGILTQTGTEFSHTFETEGVYDYYCIPHEALGMIGTVVVGEPSAEGQPGLAPPQSDLPEGARTELERLNAAVAEQL
ncbi:MAG TPA: plastocyanin/azurin family copper-binding protein [Halobacteriales archaeon]|nr:plastocyanin/azurin family copper-binding protein [Halobacteriales archaeon]